ncbi:MAG: phosphate ABC transporter permease subunit PstC [Candidatus Altiarchaeota archaeon]
MKININAEKIVSALLSVFSITAISILLLIIVFILDSALPTFSRVNLADFLFGDKWIPGKNLFGAFPFILSTVFVTISAMAIAIPFGVSCAIFLSEIAPSWSKKIVRPAIELLAGIPSVIYGLFALVIIVNFVKVSLNLATGETIFSAAIILAIMVLPTIISISQDAIESVPKIYREGAYAMGATRWEVISKVVLPAAKPGIIAAIILSIGRAIGETMAVVLVIGNVEKIPMSFLDPGETLTSAILLEMGESTVKSLHYSALFSLGLIPLIIVLILSFISNRLILKTKERFA